jgi:hypothetical protein
VHHEVAPVAYDEHKRHARICHHVCFGEKLPRAANSCSTSWQVASLRPRNETTEHGLESHNISKGGGGLRQNCTLSRKTYGNCFLGCWAMHVSWSAAEGAKLSMRLATSIGSKEMRCALCEKRPMKDSVILHTQCMISHCVSTSQTIAKNSWEMRPHPVHSPDLAPFRLPPIRVLERSHDRPELRERQRCPRSRV